MTTAQPRAARPADTRVHLDDDHVPVLGVDGHLHIGTAALHAHLADDGDSGVAQSLVLLVGERLRGGDGDGVTYGAGETQHRGGR